jgi:glycine hydroxymethyltransferase
MGTPAITTRGMKEDQMDLIAGWINTIAENLEDEAVIAKVSIEGEELCAQFPLPESFLQPQ